MQAFLAKFYRFALNARSWHHKSLLQSYDRFVVRHLLCALRALKNWLWFDFRVLVRPFFIFNLSVTFSILLERWSTLLFGVGLSWSQNRSRCALNRMAKVSAASAGTVSPEQSEMDQTDDRR